jgi:hypothetical protein
MNEGSVYDKWNISVVICDTDENQLCSLEPKKYFGAFLPMGSYI